MRILLVEDEPHLNKTLHKLLTQQHYAVDSCKNGSDAWDHIAVTSYDAIILDRMLPGLDGITLLRRMRERQNHTPVLLLTALGGIDDRVTGLDAGADDYLTKPFANEELLARLRVLLRRKSSGVTSNVLTLADLQMDCALHTVTRAGQNISLSSREFALLEYLLRNAGIVLSRSRIEEHIWSYEYEGNSNIVDVYIRSLRRKLDQDHEKKLIHTIRNVGYVLREET